MGGSRGVELVSGGGKARTTDYIDWDRRLGYDCGMMRDLWSFRDGDCSCVKAQRRKGEELNGDLRSFRRGGLSSVVCRLSSRPEGSAQFRVESRN